ncbi:MAG: SDR family oxidoreductase [Burkholderiales bacterium]
MQPAANVLTGRKALVVGVANEHSIAYGCARAFKDLGADVAITYVNEKTRSHVEPLARELNATLLMPLDVTLDAQVEAVFDRVHAEWGRLDILVHSLGWAPKEDLRGPLLECSAKGFLDAMNVSTHSLIRLARLAVPLMTDGGTILAMSYYGANKVVANYNVMGPIKAALEACCRYLAYELGPRGIQVLATRAPSVGNTSPLIEPLSRVCGSVGRSGTTSAMLRRLLVRATVSDFKDCAAMHKTGSHDRSCRWQIDQ